MSKWKVAFLYGLFLIFISYFTLSAAGYDYDYEDQKVDSWGRCPWIRNRLKNGRVRVRSRGRIAKFTCKSGYELVGRKFATCVRGQWNNPIPVCIAKGCSKIPAIANGIVSEKYKGAKLTFDCNPGYSLQGDASIFCDGSQWDKSAPTCQAATLQPQKTCDFEDPDLCGWSHDPTHDFEWKRHQFKTPSGHVGTGPSYDHTFGKGKAGYYMYEEASAPRNINDTSRLFSPVYSNNYSPGCFAFWYHMYGATIGRLRIYIKPESHVFVELTPAWEKSGDQGNQWLRGNVTVPTLNENFQIVIEGIRGTSYLGDTAIDDVNLLKADCNSMESSNITETEEASGDSCRGRCHESDNFTTCGCTDTCESDNTCCADYAKLCVEGGSEPPSGEEESVTGKLETDATPEDKVGTEYTATPPVLSTEFINSTENQPNVTEIIGKSTMQVLTSLSSTASPTATDVRVNTSTVGTTKASTIPDERVPLTINTSESVPTVTEGTTNFTTTESTTLRAAPATSIPVLTTKKATTVTPSTTTITTKGALTSSSRDTSEVTTFIVSTLEISNVTLPATDKNLVVPTTSTATPTTTNPTTEPTTSPTSTSSTLATKVTTEEMSTTAVVTVPAAVITTVKTQTSSAATTPESAKDPSLTSTIGTTQTPTTFPVTSTQTPGRSSTAPTTVITSTITTVTKPTSVRTSTQVPQNTVRPYRPIPRKTVFPVIPTTRRTYLLKTSTTKTVTYVVSQIYTTKFQTTTVDSLKDDTNALKSKTVAPTGSSSSVIGASIGVIIIVCLIGGVIFVFLRRRRQKLNKLHGDSIRFLPDNEVIEYSEASATDSLFQS